MLLPGWVQSRVAHYNLGEMSIVLGVYAAVAVFVAVAVGCLAFALGVPQDTAVFCGLGSWLLLVGWLWLGFVIVGRQSPERRTSSADLTALQVIFLVAIALLILETPAADRPAWHIAELVTEWIVVWFHIIYFTLAWATRAPVPVKTYVLFILLLGLAVVRSGGGPPNNRVNAPVRPVTPLAAASVAPVGPARYAGC